MIDVLAWAAGPLSGVACYAIGYRAGRRNRQPAKSTFSEPVCGCEHPLAMHDPETGRCHEKYPVDNWERAGKSRPSGVCPCRQYTGPKPIDQVFQPRVIFPEGS